MYYEIMGRLSFIILIVTTSAGLAQGNFNNEIVAVLKDQTLTKATWALKEQPVTVTAFVSPRSAGGRHDFYSSGKLPSAAIWLGSKTVLYLSLQSITRSRLPVNFAKAATCITQQVPWLFLAFISSIPY